MVSFKIGMGAGTLLAAAWLGAMPLAALSMRECSAAYQQARKSGALDGMGWQEFRKSRCGTAAAPTAGPSTGLAPGGSASLPGARAVFPSAVAPKYNGETAGKARRQT